LQQPAKRIAALDALNNCPVCGAKRGLSLGGRKNRKLSFDCGAVFFVMPGRAISGMLACPGPSNTAALLLDLAIAEAEQPKVGAA
jgi:hypothetical protein